MRESKELYSSGEEVNIGIYQNLKTLKLVRINQDGDILPEESDNKVVVYQRLSGDPNWQDNVKKNGVGS
ncbi:MAG: hypothetical protein HYU63_08125 [Armatimonadetes bacterium]|nr:hypothetical protein [Armatimonadota bacterium]